MKHNTRDHRDHTQLAIHGGALLLYAVLACIATFPLLYHLPNRLPTIPGELGQDVWQNSWNVWWVYHALIEEHTNPYVTDMLFYPHGASLYLHSLILPLGIIGMPLSALTNSVIAYNVLTLLVLTLAGYTSFLFVRSQVQHTAAALVAGAIVLYSPQRLLELRGAQMATLNDYGVPLTLLALTTLLYHRPHSWRAAVLVAATLLLNGVNKWYHLFHVLLVLAMILAWRGASAWRRGGIPLLHNELRPWLRVAIASSVLLMPFLLPAAYEALTTRYAQKSDVLVMSASVDIAHVLPPTFGGVWHPVPPDWWQPSMISYVVLLLAFGGTYVAWKQVRMWATIAIACFILSLGPRLMIGGVESNIPLPYALFRALPLVEIFRAPVRINFLTTLILALLAAYYVKWLLQQCTTSLWHTMASWASVLLLIAIIGAETLRLPFPLVSASLSPFYKKIANEPGNWSVLELPFDRFDREVLEMYQQTHHHKYILTGRPARSVPGIPYETAPPIAQAHTTDQRDDIVQLTAQERDALLRALRVRYLIVRHDNLLQAGRAARQVAAARQSLGTLSLAYDDAELAAYQLDDVAQWLDTEGRDTTTPVPLFLGLDTRWEPLEESGYGLTRWLPRNGAGVVVYSQQQRRALLVLSLYSIAGSGTLDVWLNGQLTTTLPIANGEILRTYITSPLLVPAGRSTIELRTSLAGVSPQSLGRGNDARPLTFSIHHIALQEVQ